MPKTLLLLALLSLYACQAQTENEAPEAETPPYTPQIAPNSFLNYNQIDQVVRRMHQDRHGNYWFAAQAGAFRYSNDTLHLFENTLNEHGQGVTVHDLTEAPDGTIWLATTGGVSSIQGDVVTNYYTTDGLPHSDAWTITADRTGTIWIGTYGGLCYFRNGTFTPIELPEGKRDTTVGVSSTRMINNILEDRNGTLWVSSNAGLFTVKNYVPTRAPQHKVFQTPYLNILFEDREGGLWITDKAGLYLLKNDHVTNITAGKMELGKGIGSVAQDQDGTIWFVANQHHLYRYNGQAITEFQKAPDNPGPVIFQIYLDQQDRLWFVGFGGVYRLENGEFVHVSANGPW